MVSRVTVLLAKPEDGLTAEPKKGEILFWGHVLQLKNNPAIVFLHKTMYSRNL